VLTLAVGVLIIAGGIDLSIGSLVALSATCYTVLLENGLGHCWERCSSSRAQPVSG
jgi:ribose/xylose/arabinose/galactoside ABC-type transport system permease subunit